MVPKRIRCPRCKSIFLSDETACPHCRLVIDGIALPEAKPQPEYVSLFRESFHAYIVVAVIVLVVYSGNYIYSPWAEAREAEQQYNNMVEGLRRASIAGDKEASRRHLQWVEDENKRRDLVRQQEREGR